MEHPQGVPWGPFNQFRTTFAPAGLEWWLVEVAWLRSGGAIWPHVADTRGSAMRSPQAVRGRPRPAPGMGGAWVTVVGALCAVRVRGKRARKSGL